MKHEDLRTDEALMLAYRDGDAAAFDTLYDRWRGRLYRYIAHQAQSHADEIFQDVWMRIIGARSSYEVSAKFSTWIFRIATNRLTDHFRSQSRGPVAGWSSADEEREFLDTVPAPETERPLSMLERKELSRLILYAIDQLPDSQRQVFLLQEEGELTLDEIARVTEAGRETVKTRLRYAYAKLRGSLACVLDREAEDA